MKCRIHICSWFSSFMLFWCPVMLCCFGHVVLVSSHVLLVMLCCFGVLSCYVVLVPNHVLLVMLCCFGVPSHYVVLVSCSFSHVMLFWCPVMLFWCPVMFFWSCYVVLVSSHLMLFWCPVMLCCFGHVMLF